jgi:hypothetical protein
MKTLECCLGAFLNSAAMFSSSWAADEVSTVRVAFARHVDVMPAGILHQIRQAIVLPSLQIELSGEQLDGAVSV